MRARSCLMFLTQLARCHWALSQSAWVTSAQPGQPGPVGLDELAAAVRVGLLNLAHADTVTSAWSAQTRPATDCEDPAVPLC